MDIGLQSLQVLWTEYERRLTIASISKKTIRASKKLVERLDAFMLSNGHQEYNAEVGQLFLLHLKKDLSFSSNVIKDYESKIRHLDSCMTDQFWGHEYRLNNYEIQHTQLKDYHEKLLSDLLRVDIKDGIRQYSTRCIQCLDIYMLENHIEFYSPEVGTEYLICMESISGMSSEFLNIAYRNTIRRINAYYNKLSPLVRTTAAYQFVNHDIEQALTVTLERLTNLHYSKDAIQNVVRAIRYLDMYMVDHDIEHYDAETKKAFLDDSKRRYKPDANRDIPVVAAIAHFEDTWFANTPQRYHTKKEIVIPEAFIDAYNAFVSDCKENNNKDVTIFQNKLICFRVFKSLESLGCARIQDVTYQQIVDVCNSINKHCWSVIRGILKSCVKHEIVDKDYSFAVPIHKRKIIIPPNYTKEERIALEQAPDKNTPIGKRDYAIILLVDRLAFRSSDVVNLKFSNMDRDKKLICIKQFKTEEPLILPLLDEIETAIDDYVQNGRPSSASDHIFLMSYAPYEPISAIAVHGIFTRHLKTAGIDAAGRKHGGHAFRASAASSYVNNGMTYDEVRFILGHQDPDMIKHYASLDMSKLRLCALSPSPAGFKFQHYLSQEEKVVW